VYTVEHGEEGEMRRGNKLERTAGKSRIDYDKAHSGGTVRRDKVHIYVAELRPNARLAVATRIYSTR
jgi:hypothetical protein